MITWTKGRKTVNEEGTTLPYYGLGTNLTIESRKRHIPHAGGREGTWDHTTYWLLEGSRPVKEFWSLKDAKEYAEGMNV